MNPTRKRLRRRNEIQKAKSAAGVRARERNRLAQHQESGRWPVIKTLILVVTASPDGRHMGIGAVKVPTWYRCGTERAVMTALRRLIYGRATR